jgi:hypothetical protein
MNRLHPDARDYPQTATTVAPLVDARGYKVWRDNSSGLIIRDPSGAEVFMQPGDDANELQDALEACDTHAAQADTLAAYFGG